MLVEDDGVESSFGDIALRRATVTGRMIVTLRGGPKGESTKGPSTDAHTRDELSLRHGPPKQKHAFFVLLHNIARNFTVLGYHHGEYST